MNNIEEIIKVVDQALGWSQHVPLSEQLSYKKKLINIRREFKKIWYAISEPCSTAAFGESQMGKSYLVSAMLSSPSMPFAVTSEQSKYDFISEINPSRPNSSIESTGVITRFTTNEDKNTPSGFLKVQLLSISDIILILCESYYNQVDYSREKILSKDTINEIINNQIITPNQEPLEFITEDDILDVREYINQSSILQKKCNHVLESELFNYMVMNISKMDEAFFTEIVQLLWNKDEHIGKLWKDMFNTYKRLDYKSVVFVRFDSVLKRKGTLLDVARLDEMYGEPEDKGSEFEPNAMIMTDSKGEPQQIEKSFLSSLIAELSFTLPKDLIASRPFLKDLDILDFPGARRPEQIKQTKLNEGKNLSTVLRRGKVSYLFNKYSAAKRISTLLFCHNNSMSGESSMGGLLDNWVKTNIGKDTKGREEYVKTSSIPPLFIIGTWFNKDLEYHDEMPNDPDNLNARWNRRFNVVLEKEVLKSLGDKEHWFNKWSLTTEAFQNIYMLRDFKYSRDIYPGYDPNKGTPESGNVIAPSNYPSFFIDLKESFLNNKFVKQHFPSPSESWDDAATCAMDGTKRIIQKLNIIAPNVSKAREEKFNYDLKQILDELKSLLESYYHPDSSPEQLKLAKRQAADACIQIDTMNGQDPYSFGRFMDAMMVKESEIYELVHSLVLGEEQFIPMSDTTSQIFMSAGLDSSESREYNIKKLCDYFGVDEEQECIKYLEDQGLDLEELLSPTQIMTDKAKNLVNVIEKMWHDKVLTSRTVNLFDDKIHAVSVITSTLWRVYKRLNFKTKLIKKVRQYINNINKETSVGIISDYLSMQYNEFTNTFGYSFYTEEDKKNLERKNGELNLGIKYKDLISDNTQQNMELLAELETQKLILAKNRNDFTEKDRDFLSKYPQYKRIWKWQQQLRVGYLFSSDLPDYDVKANNKLKVILENLKG